MARTVGWNERVWRSCEVLWIQCRRQWNYRWPHVRAFIQRHPREVIGGAAVILAGLIGLAAWIHNSAASHSIALSADHDASLRKLVAVAAADPEIACRTAVEMLTDNSPAADYVAVAAVLAAASKATDDRLLAEHRAARSVLYLQHAAGMGAEGSAIAQSPDFAPLAKRSDFRALMRGWPLR